MQDNHPFEEQISFLKYKSGMSKKFLRGSFIVGCICLAVAAYVKNVSSGIIGLLFFVWCYREYRSFPMIQNALQAWHEAKPPRRGSLTIITEMYDNITSYGGIISYDYSHWKYDFLPPIKWAPTNRKYVAQLYFIEGCSWPCLIATDEGILCPNAPPKKTNSA